MVRKGGFFPSGISGEISKQNGAYGENESPAFAGGYANLFAQLVHIYQSSRARGTRARVPHSRSCYSVATAAPEKRLDVP